MRQLLDSRPIPAIARRHPRASLAVIAAVTIAAAFGVWTVALGPGDTPDAPSVDRAASWSFRELGERLESRDIVSIGHAGRVAGDAAGGPLLVTTRAGELVAVTLPMDATDALAAIAAMGHGEVLTREAWATLTAGKAPADGGTIPGLLQTALLIAGVAAVAFILIRRRGSLLPGLGRDAARFATIMPASRDDVTESGTLRAGARGAALGPVAPDVRLDDVAGCDDAKLELSETIEFLRDPARFRALGARIPRGTLLYGPPGTGKTMLAKGVAAEAGVPFHYASGSEFVEKYVGVGAKRIRQLFAQARKLGLGVIFLDEFDAIGKARGGQGSHEEREQTLNQLLVELDGFGSTDDVVVIAATNRLDILDSALLRPGRFSRKVHVGLPDVVGRRAILDVHARNKPLAADVDLETFARKSYGFSGAQLADMLNEGAILAARRAATQIATEDLHGGWLKVSIGTSRRRSMSERERSIIAAHEVGHAIAGRTHGDSRHVEEISLFAHGEALGVTVSSQEDNDLPCESDIRARLVALMGGRAAEELLFQEVTPGASNDFEKANRLASMMVTKWGMGRDPSDASGGTSGRGALSFHVSRQGESLPSELQAAATRAIRAILDEAYETARRTLQTHLATLRRIAVYLLEHERIDGETFDALFEGRIDVPDADREWRPDSARPRGWAEVAAFSAVGADTATT